jgi:hypothetical protein
VNSLGRSTVFSLNALDERAALLRRKYVLTADAFGRLARRLSADHQVLDIEGRQRFATAPPISRPPIYAALSIT